MTENTDIQLLVSEYGGIFLLMFSTFLVGYFSSYILNTRKKDTLIKKLKRDFNKEKAKNDINNIETIFTEIKPKIVDIVKEAQQNLKTTPSEEKNSSAEKAKTTYVSYTKNKPSLSLEKLGAGSKENADDLTKIDGIGPYVEERLNGIGIYNYTQISKLEISDIRIITDLIEFFPGRIERDQWVKQAQSLLQFQHN